MATEIPFKITVDTDIADLSVGELKQAFKDLTTELNSTTVGTEKYKQTLTKLGDVKGGLMDLKQQIIALDPEKRFRAIAQIGSSIASGFAAAQGAVALFGGESEDLTKVLVRVQAATALASGLQGLAGFGKALETARLAMIAFAASNPLTLILLGIVALATAVVALGNDTDELAEKQKKQKSEAEALIKTNNQLADSYNDVLKKEDDLALKRAVAAGKITQEQADVIKRQQEFFEKAEVFRQQHEDRLLKIALNGKLSTFEQGQQRIASEKLFNDQLNTLEEDFQIDKALIKEKHTKREENKDVVRKEKELDLEAEHLKRMIKLGQEAADERARQTKNLIDTVAAHRDKDWEKEQKRMNEEAEEEAEMEKYKADLKINLNKQAFNTIGNLSDTLFSNALINAKGNARREYEIKRGQFRFNKALSATDAAIATISAVQKNYAQGGLAIGSALNIAQIAIGAANVAAILAKKYPAFEGDGGDTGTVSAPNLQSPQTSNNQAASFSETSVNKNKEGNFGSFNQGPIKAYVVETEITNKQKGVKSIEEKTTF